MPDGQIEELLAPELLQAPEPSRAKQIGLLALAGTAAAALFFGLGMPGASNENPADLLADYRAPAGAVTAIIPDTDQAAIAQGLSLLKLDPAALDELKRELEAGRVRLGVARVWDWADSDADAAVVSSAGFQQLVTISATPTVVIVPIASDSALSVTPVRDGMGGGVTVAFVSGTKDIRLRPLAGRDSVMVALP